MGLEDDEKIVKEGKSEENEEKETPPSAAAYNSDTGESQNLSRQPSEASCYATEEEEESQIQLGPKWSIKQHLEKDKDDESLRRWKEQLLGSVDVNGVEANKGACHPYHLYCRQGWEWEWEHKSLFHEKLTKYCPKCSSEVEEPDVKIMSLTIISPDRPDIVLEIPESGNPKGQWFTLKEGSRYRLRFTIKVCNDIVCGLRYTNTIWKTGIKVDSSKQMLGTFSPQAEPYTHEMPEETTPSGMFARGSYSARTKFVDDDNKCYLELNYTFDIQKEWTSN